MPRASSSQRIRLGRAVLVGAHPRHAPEAADVAKRDRLDAIEREVLEVDVVRRARLLLQERFARAVVFDRHDLDAGAEDRHAAEGERLIVPAERFGHQHRGLGLRLQVRRVLGEIREKEKRTAQRVHRDGHERPIREAARLTSDRRQRRGHGLRRKRAASLGVARSARGGCRLFFARCRTAVIGGHARIPNSPRPVRPSAAPPSSSRTRTATSSSWASHRRRAPGCAAPACSGGSRAASRLRSRRRRTAS